MNFKAVIFDLDGTLLDTIDDLTDTVNTVLAGWGLPTHDREAYKFFVGDGVKILITRSLPENMRTEQRINEGVVKMREEYSRRWKNKTKPYDGVSELLDALTTRNMRLTVLSNKPDEFTKLMVQTYFSRWNFDVVLGGRPGVALKPDPAAAVEVASILRLKPEEFAYLGDTRTDMETATGAKMYPVGVLWGFRPAEELKKSGAKTLIDHPLDLIRLFDLS